MITRLSQLSYAVGEQQVELVQAASNSSSGYWLCDRGAECEAESLYVLGMVFGLLMAIGAILTAFFFFREDKEEQITPLCPQLVVRESELSIHLPFSEDWNLVTVTDLAGKVRGRLALDTPDPFHSQSRDGVVATVRLQSEADVTLATVVAKISQQGLQLNLHKGNSEFFGIVRAEPPRRYTVKHRTGIHLLTLTGDFGTLDVDGSNPVGSRVCTFKSAGNDCTGRILQHVDAGLVLCSLMATYVHRKGMFALAAASMQMQQPQLWNPHQEPDMATELPAREDREGDAESPAGPDVAGAPVFRGWDTSQESAALLGSEGGQELLASAPGLSPRMEGSFPQPGSPESPEAAMSPRSPRLPSGDSSRRSSPRPRREDLDSASQPPPAD